ncbi:MAG: hypothetical protein IJ863_03670 [Spirochaetales bacterium]|nr:hypothetical protein [Spirochaetales bacterium]
MSRKYRIPVLTEEILDQIIWGMENQDFVYSLNTQDGTVYCPEVSEETVPDEYLVELPPWHSSDGYQIMVSFTNACKDHELQGRLIRELNSRTHGVFRRFRDVLSTDQNALQQFYSFKDSKMKSFIRSWYRKNYGKMTESDHEGSDELPMGELLADFEINHLEPIDQYCIDLLKAYTGSSAVKAKIIEAFTNKEAFVIMKGNVECGALIYEKVGREACVLYYYVEPQFRRMGLFSLAFDLLNRELERGQVTSVAMPFSAESAFFKQVFHDHDVVTKQFGDSFLYNIKDWNDNADSAEFAYVL